MSRRLSIGMIIMIACCVTVVQARENRPVGIRLGGLFCWGPDFYFVNSVGVAPADNDSFWMHHGYRGDTATFAGSPLMGAHLLLLLPLDKHLSLEFGPAAAWKESRLIRYLPDPVPGGYDRVMIKFNYWSIVPELGLYYSKKYERITARAGGFICGGFSGWASSIDNYKKSGEKCGEDFWGMSGCTPLGLNGDKKSNAAIGFEFGGGIKAGGEYTITRHLSFTLEALIRYSRSIVEFIPDHHLWENTASYQDYHSEILFVTTIEDDAVFSVSPSMFGVSTGLIWYF